MDPPLSEICRFVSFTDLSDKLRDVSGYVHYLRPEFFEELSESCIAEQT
jgi:hypothetical protein